MTKPKDNTTSERETWLNILAELITIEMNKRDIETADKYRVSCGWPSTGGLGTKNRTRGECWTDKASADKHFEIFISPMEDDPKTVAAILTHELIHAAVGIEAGHGKKFQAVAKKLGYVKPFTSSNNRTGDFDDWMNPLLAATDPYPHGRLNALSKKKKKQGTRLIKCECDTCGYNVRITRKWLNEVGSPHCPDHGEMTPDLEN